MCVRECVAFGIENEEKEKKKKEQKARQSVGGTKDIFMGVATNQKKEKRRREGGKIERTTQGREGRRRRREKRHKAKEKTKEKEKTKNKKRPPHQVNKVKRSLMSESE